MFVAENLINNSILKMNNCGLEILTALRRPRLSVLLNSLENRWAPFFGFFDPSEESSPLLKDWLNYRGQLCPEDQFLAHEELVKLAQEDLTTTPDQTFSNFIDFDPTQASSAFLKAWLSWHGVTYLSSSVKKETWVARASLIRSSLAEGCVKTNQSPEETFNLRVQTLRHWQRCLLLLNEQLWDLDSNVLSKMTETNFLALCKQIIKKRIEKKESTEDVWPEQKKTAVMLEMDCVAVPIVFDTKRKQYTFLSNIIAREYLKKQNNDSELKKNVLKQMKLPEDSQHWLKTIGGSSSPEERDIINNAIEPAFKDMPGIAAQIESIPLAYSLSAKFGGLPVLPFFLLTHQINEETKREQLLQILFSELAQYSTKKGNYVVPKFLKP